MAGLTGQEGLCLTEIREYRKLPEQSKGQGVGQQEISEHPVGLVESCNIRLRSREGQSHGHNERLAKGV